MNIFNFEEEESYQSSAPSEEDLTTPPNVNFLNPPQVLSLASSIPHCCQISPPKPPLLPSTSSPKLVKSHSNSSNSYTDSISLSILPTSSSLDSGVFSSFRKRIKEKFGRDGCEGEEILTFLVSEAESECDNNDSGDQEWGELEGCGIARIDVYCRSGTVCIIRVIHNTHSAQEDTLSHIKTESASIKTSYSLSPSAVLSSLLPTPRQTNVNVDTFFSSSGSESRKSSFSKKGSPSTGNVQIRRIFRRKVNLEGLRRIIMNPPKLIEISEELVEYEDVTPNNSNVSSGGTTNTNINNTGGNTNSSNTNYSNNSNSAGQNQPNPSISTAQQRYLLRERKKIHRRLAREERTRQKMANLILSGYGADEQDLNCPSVDSIDTADSLEGNPLSSSGISKDNKEDELTQRQLELQKKIELADMGLAILTGEVESIERMMELLRKEQFPQAVAVDTDDVDTTLSKDESEMISSVRGRNHPREGGDKKHRGREGKKTNMTLLSERGSSPSRSVSSKRRFSSFSTYEQDSSSSDSLDDDEAEAIARMLQGCEVEYSFPYDFHDELEDALLAQEFASDDNDDRKSFSDDDTVDDESTVGRRNSMGSVKSCRTRHRYSKKRREIPTIVAVPTNGQGCIVLRNSGAFSVIGNLPKAMYKELFKKKAPFPEYIALGTKGRYYVRFENGSYKFSGPSSLKSILNESAQYDSAKSKNYSRFSVDGIKKNLKKKKEIENRHHHPLAISSLAFGKRVDDFFLVRNDGSWECNGDLPRSLEKLLDDRRGRGDLEWVSLGPEGEWCLKARNERIWWGGVSEEVDDHLSRILIEDEEIGRVSDLKFIDFGVNDSFFLLYQ